MFGWIGYLKLLKPFHLIGLRMIIIPKPPGRFPSPNIIALMITVQDWIELLKGVHFHFSSKSVPALDSWKNILRTRLTTIPAHVAPWLKKCYVCYASPEPLEKPLGSKNSKKQFLYLLFRSFKATMTHWSSLNCLTALTWVLLQCD